MPSVRKVHGKRNYSGIDLTSFCFIILDFDLGDEPLQRGSYPWTLLCLAYA